MRPTVVIALILASFALAGCGGDNLSLCEGCGTPIPTVTVTPTATGATPTPTSPTPASTIPTPTAAPTPA